jgi:large subunit ribosomal protein L29
MRAKIETIRALPDERLTEEEFETRMEIMNLRFKIATHQVSSFGGLRDAKRRLAHILTVQRERELLGSKA